MDVSDRRMQVQLTQEAKIASDFLYIRAIFAVVGFVSALQTPRSMFRAAFCLCRRAVPSLQTRESPASNEGAGQGNVSCQILLALASRYFSASGLHRPLLRSQISASLANIGSVLPFSAKSAMAVSGRSIWV